MDKWEYQNKLCHLENHVVREPCKQRTACTTRSNGCQRWNYSQLLVFLDRQVNTNEFYMVLRLLTFFPTGVWWVFNSFQKSFPKKKSGKNVNFEGREMTLEPIPNPFLRIWPQILEESMAKSKGWHVKVRGRAKRLLEHVCDVRVCRHFEAGRTPHMRDRTWLH